MLKIIVDKKNIERALSSYKHKVRKTKQIIDLRENREYEKPSAEKRKKIQKAKYIQKKSESSNL